MDIKTVTHALDDRGLTPPDLEMLRSNSSQYITLLMQPNGPIYANIDRIGAYDQAAASVKGKSFLELAVTRGAHLAVTPEYFFPWAAILESINNGLVPPDDALWVLGSESITQTELEAFEREVSGRCVVIYEPLEKLVRSRELLNPVVLLFQAENSNGSKQLVALIQFKIQPSRDPRFFEESVLKRGSLVYQFEGTNSELTAAVIICADAFALAELDRNSLSKFNNQATLIHIQLNPNPRHIAYREYRTTTFSTDANATNCHIVCLNWAHSIEAYTKLEGESKAWGNIAGSTWYCPLNGCSYDDADVLSNHAFGLYYAYMEEYRHALLFHYDEAVFELFVPKLITTMSAVLVNKNGPAAKGRYEWKEEIKSWECGVYPVESGFNDLIQHIPNAQLALSKILPQENMLNVERVLSLSAGSIKGGERWYEAKNIDSCQIEANEVVNRVTVVQDTAETAHEFRHNRFTPLMTIHNELMNQTNWPPQISDVNSHSEIFWVKSKPNFNVLTADSKPTLIVYLGESPSSTRLENTVAMLYTLLRREDTPYQRRLCVAHRENGRIVFAPISAMTRIDDPTDNQTNILALPLFQDMRN